MPKPRAEQHGCVFETTHMFVVAVVSPPPVVLLSELHPAANARPHTVAVPIVGTFGPAVALLFKHKTNVGGWVLL